MPPRKVTKTKTFAGCWTCRRRKVKCDNYRPQCRRCGVTCEGYNVDLYWMDDEADRPCAVKRRAMLIQDSRLPVQIALEEIDRMLDELEEMVDVIGAGFVGAFSAFTLDQAREEPNMTSLNEADDEETSIASSPQIDHAVVLAEGLPMYADTVTAELMHNYIHVVADLLQPAHHTHNPYRSLYVPKAMEAAAATLFVGVGGTPSRAGTALFHALLAVSAFQMHRHRPDQAQYNSMGRTHRIMAIESLQRSLAGPGVSTDSHTTMSAILSMASIDLMEGSMTDFWIHLAGCEKLRAVMVIQSGEPKTTHLSQTAQLLTTSAFMSTLSRSTDPYLPPRAWRDNNSSSGSLDYLLQSCPFRTDDHSLEFTYGITATLARYMDLTIRLSQHLAYYEARNLVLPDSLEKALSTAHKALTGWSITNEPLTSVRGEGDHETLSLVTCHILAFHAALVIYFYSRTSYWHGHPGYNFPSSSPTQISGDLIRQYNRVCVTNLLAAEALKSACSTQTGWNAMAPIVWPGFIAACEAEPDERPLWRTWWMGVQRYCIGSIATLWEVVQEVWEAEQEEEVEGVGETPRWMRVLSRSGRRVMSGG
ncbi:fungal-specific transcription factor domain-containing protein [Aspergillus pseudoustus]|uniref:Fungal-specific transcription factor domain-containing protein n=1 Tax=Aspergillus pseudoustus TaxID=1810923 RepID=A0ABR4K0P6_9EURO